jgi:hypothetical protein
MNKSKAKNECWLGTTYVRNIVVLLELAYSRFFYLGLSSLYFSYNSDVICSWREGIERISYFMR